MRLKESFGVGGKGVYVSLDDLWFSTHGIRDAIAYFESHGYTHVFIDEVHHFGKDWSLLIKNVYDQFPELNFVYSGSALLKIEEGHGDLARRQGSYGLKGLSFREFLAFEGVLDVPPLALEEILGNHRKIAQDIVASVRVLPLFEKYLECGYYPFYKEPGGLYQQRLRAIVSKVLESDWPAVEDVSVETVRKAKKMLMILASSVPQSPNMSRLYQQLETERNTWHFEVGGAGKGFDQVKDIPTAYVVNDDTEIGLGNKIPLWLFGFLY